MRTAKRPRSKLSSKTAEYKPEDLEAMRQAFIIACHEHPDLSATEAQRYDLADVLVNVYQKHFTQHELVTATLVKIREMKAKRPSETDEEA